MVGPLGRAGASGPVVPPPAAQTENQAAAERPVRGETPVGLSLTPTVEDRGCKKRFKKKKDFQQNSLCTRAPSGDEGQQHGKEEDIFLA